jgi:hypothetical protein
MFSHLTPQSGVLLGLFAVLGLIAMFGLYKGVRTGMKRARALSGDSKLLWRHSDHTELDNI